VATNNLKKEKISQSNVILGESTKKFKNIQWQKKVAKHHPGSTIVHLRRMAKSVDGKWRFVVKVPNHNHPAYPPEAHPMHQHLDETQFESVIALTQACARPLQDLS